MFVTLLGSYDPETKKLLYAIRESIARKFSDEGVYSMLMETLEYYVVNQLSSPISLKTYDIIVERENGVNLTFYILDGLSVEVETIPYEKDVESALFNYLIKRGLITPEAKVKNIPMAGDPSLFTFLVSISTLYFIIRLKEETRGGELIELCSILNSPNNIQVRGDKVNARTFLFKKNNITLSTMFQILLDEENVLLREFEDQDDVLNQINKIIHNSLTQK